MTAQCSVELWQPLGGVITSIPDAQDKNLTLSVSEGSTFSFTLNGFNEKASFLNEMITDVVVYREGVKIFRGRLVQAIPRGDSSGQVISCSAVDYKALLSRRHFVTSGTTTGDLEAAAWLAINNTQTVRPGSSFGITRGVNQSTGQTVTKYPYELGTNIKDFIDGLAKTNTNTGDANAFEWDIDPDLVFKVYKPTRGKRTPTFLADWGGAVLSYDVQFDPNSYSNVFFVQGNGTVTSTVVTDEGRRTPPGGMLEEFVLDSQLTTATLVDARAFWLATYHGQLELARTYNLELSNSRWLGPESCWIGDFIRLDLSHGALNVKSDEMRITDMHISFDNSGYEGVAVGVGFQVPSSYRDINRMSLFMRTTRMDMLRNRATWYDRMNRSFYQEYQLAVKKHGANSYEAKAAKTRWQNFYKQARSWQNQNLGRPL